MKRPLVCGLFFYIAGILGGQWSSNIFSLVLFCLCMLFLLIWLYDHVQWNGVFIFPLFTLLGMVLLQYQWSPQIPDQFTVIQDGMEVEIEGTIDNLFRPAVRTGYIRGDSFFSRKQMKVQIFLREEESLAYGDVVLLQGKLYTPQPPRNPGGFDQELYMAIRGIDYVFYGNIKHIDKYQGFSLTQLLYDFNRKLQEIYNRILPPPQAALLNAMILGEKSSLSDETKQVYQDTGIAHVLAISGLHISIFGLLIMNLLIWIKMPQSVRIPITILILSLYCIFTGGAVSTIRAVFMMSMILSAVLFKRTADIYTSIATSAFILLLRQPLYLWDPGFQLSFGAVTGLVLIVPVFDQFLFLPIWIRKVMGVSCAAFISTAPIIAYHFYGIPILSIILNPIVVPLVPLIILFGLIGGLLGLVWIEGARFVIGIVYYILLFFERVSTLMFHIPYGNINIGAPELWKICIYYGTIALLFAYMAKFQLMSKISFRYVVPLAGIGIFLLVYTPFGSLEVTYLDVGQGDAIAIHTPDKQNYMIDGGGNIMKSRDEPNTGIQTIIPYLKYKGINKLQGIFITHFDGDHIIGIIELLDQIKIDRLFIPDIESDLQNEYYDQLLEKATLYHIPIVSFHQGDQWNDNHINFYCIYPSDHIVLNNVEEQNHSSLVLYMNYENHNFLFTGDIEKEDEQWIIKQYPLLSSNILKVPHHGSNTSSTDEFIDHIKPKIAVISCGKNNVYGHPHKEVVDRYVQRDIALYNTAQDGAIIIKGYKNKEKIIPFLHTRKDTIYAKNKK